MDPNESAAERLERLFSEALELESDSREAFLRSACGGDDQLHGKLSKLLAANDRAGGNPAWREPAIQHEAVSTGLAETESTMERYRLLETIGSGGMGIVYRAVRADDEFSKLVAIKLLQAGAGDHSALVKRFRQERQILAGLEHPNIARLLDGGATSEGLPFLVMEFVDGVRIDRYVAEHKLSPREILALFRVICSAVSYAHQNLIVHRDLKPGNILVTAEGVPKLIDFGIAKLLDGTAERTLTGAGGMTPEYASPEQIRGGQISTATDIYSLGVLLYELLTGSRPYRATTGTLELAEAICTQPPEPMQVGAELENIVRMALRKEPERRYQSAEQFSEDIRRYLEGYPILARPATRGYLARKFAARNKAPIAAGVLLLMSLLGGIAATTWQARLANQRFNDVRDLANSYLFEIDDAIKDLPGTTKARQLVVKRGIQYLDKLASQRGSDTSLQRELAKAYDKVGDIQGAFGSPNLGDPAGALATYRKALALRETLAAADPRNPGLAVELNESYLRVGQCLQMSGDLHAALAIDQKGVEKLEAVALQDPASVPVRVNLAASYALLANVTGNNEQPNLGDARGAMAFFLKAKSIREKLVLDDPGNRENRMRLGVNYIFIGSLQQALDDKQASWAAFRQGSGVFEQLLSEEPLNVIYRREVALCNRSLSLLLIRMKNYGEAQKAGNRSNQLFEQIARNDEANTMAQEEYGDSLWSQGYLRATSKDWSSARKYYESSIRVYEAVAKKAGGVEPIGTRTVYQLLADVEIAAGNTDRALLCAQKELSIDERLLKANAANAGAQRNRGVAFTQIGEVHEKLASRPALTPATQLNEWTKARSWHQKAMDVWLALQKKGTLIPMYVPKIGEATKNLAKCDQALAKVRGVASGSR